MRIVLPLLNCMKLKDLGEIFIHMNTEKQKTEIDTVTTANTIDKLREYEETPGMNELISNLNMIQGSYLSFVIGAASYASKKPERLIAVINYLNSSDSLTASDVVEFILDQPDFFEDCVEPSANRR